MAKTAIPQPALEHLDDLRFEEWSVEILLEVTDLMSAADGVDAALNRLARLALNATGADRSAILVHVAGDAGRLRPAAAASRSGNLGEMWERFRRMPAIDVPGLLEALSQHVRPHATLIERASGANLVPAEWKRTWGSQSIAYVPLCAGGELFGLLAVDYVNAPHRFTHGETRILEAIAGAAGVALRGARLLEQQQRAIEVERRLSECTAALRSGGSLDEILTVVADRFGSLLSDAACSINLVGADGAAFRTVASRGAPATLGEVQISDLPAQGVDEVRRIWLEDPRRVIVIDDLRDHPGWDRFVPAGITTGMLLPLVDDGSLLGFIAAGRAGEPFSADEIRVARSFADHAALALAQARLTETLQVRLRFIEALSRLGDTVMRTSDLRSLLGPLNREIGATVGIECSRISFGDANLAEFLGVPVADDRERKLLAVWRRGSTDPVENGLEHGVPILLSHRPAGVLWVRLTSKDPKRIDLARAMASGIGEVAFKAKLQRTAERRAQELAIASERERIARDLHDTVGQTLYGIGLKIQDALWEIDDPAVQERLIPLRALASQGVADVRSAIYALSFLHVRDRGFVPSLRALAKQFAEATEVGAQFRVSGAIPPLSDDVEAALYRVAHEALVNVDRHARATGLDILLTATQSWLTLVIRDDGVGLGQRDVMDWRSAAHFGMRTMARSVERVGGTFRVGANRPRGLVIEARVPVGPKR